MNGADLVGVVGTRSIQDCSEVVTSEVPVVFVVDPLECFPDEICGRIADHVFGCLGNVGDNSISTHHKDDVRSVLNQRAKATFVRCDSLVRLGL